MAITDLRDDEEDLRRTARVPREVTAEEFAQRVRPLRAPADQIAVIAVRYFGPVTG